MKIFKDVFAHYKAYRTKKKIQKYIAPPFCNNIKIEKDILKNIRIAIKGRNNTIEMKNLKLAEGAVLYIKIHGDNNSILLDSISLSGKMDIRMGAEHDNFGPISNHYIEIKRETSIESLTYVTYNSNTGCIIGEKCMLAFDIVIYNTDAHAILDYSTKKLVNYVKGINIGNHCWIGQSVSIMKNTSLADDCIVGGFSVLAGRHDKSHAIYAGNPAKLVKENRTWDSNGRKYGYIDNIDVKNK